MRKTIQAPVVSSLSQEWLDLDSLAEVELTSEDKNHPIEAALIAGHETETGWLASEPGEQTIRILFDQPRALCRIHLHFVETQRDRTQEFILRASADGETFHQIVRQQWTFSRHGSREEIEDYKVDLPAMRVLELCIIPDIGGGPALAALRKLRIT